MPSFDEVRTFAGLLHKALAAAIRGREVSAYEVVLAAIARIEAVNPQLNAVMQTRFGAALAVAQEIERVSGGWQAPAW